MPKSNILEKRKHPRINKNLPVNVSLQDDDIFTETKNISCGGAYCHVDKYIKPLTKLSIKMKFSDDSEEISCKGVVVRTQEAVPTGYNIAIFFNEISQDNLNKLKNYVQRHTSV
ncbi:MAG: PilZ domain-containing protein [Candidatus Omnitrophica bacterium]|nr:PilZ domain-containing protein [Candidatus Omnitrophota bacterium]